MRAAIDRAIPRAALLAGERTPIMRAISGALASAGFAVVAEAWPASGGAFHAPLPSDGQARAFGVLVLNGALDRDVVGSEFGEVQHPPARRPLLDGASSAIEWFAGQLAKSEEAGQTRGVVVSILDHRAKPRLSMEISAALDQAALSELTQRAALTLAPRIRVNAAAISSGLSSARQTPILSSPPEFASSTAGGPGADEPDAGDFARAILAMLALSTMTGQILALSRNPGRQAAPSSGRAFAEAPLVPPASRSYDLARFPLAVPGVFRHPGKTPSWRAFSCGRFRLFHVGSSRRDLPAKRH